MGSCIKVVKNVVFLFPTEKKLSAECPIFEESKINMKEHLFSVSVQCASA
jgi:hypothetical protein